MVSITRYPGNKSLKSLSEVPKPVVNRVPSARRGQFQDILSGLKVRNSKKPYKTKGLTIADYRARAIIPKSRYRRLSQSVDAPIKNPLAINGFKKIHHRFPMQSAKISTLPAPNRRFIDKVPSETQLDKIKPQPVALTDRQMIEQTVKKTAAKYNLPPALITAVIRAESNFKVRAVSSAGAQGLMQLMPSTAKELGVKNPFDIGQNIDGGAKYLRKMLDRFGGSLRKALAAYNAGPGAVIKYNGRVPYRETRQYVRRVLRFSRQMT